MTKQEVIKKIKEDYPHKVRVKGARSRHVGYTDKEDTYCCEATPSWYVVFPGIIYNALTGWYGSNYEPYAAYFQKQSIKEV